VIETLQSRKKDVARKTLPLPSGRPIPVLGQGTWLMGEDVKKRGIEMAALRLGLDLGMTLIDTAEMYGEGAAEELVGDAIADRRAEVFLVSKVLPHNATLNGTIAACDRSLRRLKTDYLDLYLLHWRGSVPLGQTLDAFQRLKQSGKIRDYGVSNFDVDDLEEAFQLSGGDEIATDQVLYNLKHRGIEWDLLPRCRDAGIPIMAYSPIEHSPRGQKGMLENPLLKSVAGRHDATPVQIALAWLLHQRVVVIPKASDPDHVRENAGAIKIALTETDMAAIDRAFLPPRKKIPLEVK
jgi:diketogulonate reductase-like aldo/keto reductase